MTEHTVTVYKHSARCTCGWEMEVPQGRSDDLGVQARWHTRNVGTVVHRSTKEKS